jgi:protein N-terminal asparagine amidohydrolase
VNQHEFAVSHPGDSSVSILGSDDATTCHIVTVRHAESGVTCLAHVDLAEESNLDLIVEKMNALHKRLSPTGEGGDLGAATGDPLELSIVGGYEDEADRAAELTLELLEQIVRCKTRWVRSEKFCSPILGLETRKEH